MFRHDHAGLKELTHNALRIVAGFLFMQHGAQKLFGAMGGNQVEDLMSVMGIAGILEFFGGLLMMAGLLTGARCLPPGRTDGGRLLLAPRPERLLAHREPRRTRGLLQLHLALLLRRTGPGKFSVDGWLASRKAE